jgi:hypothetical protein
MYKAQTPKTEDKNNDRAPAGVGKFQFIFNVNTVKHVDSQAWSGQHRRQQQLDLQRRNCLPSVSNT